MNSLESHFQSMARNNLWSNHRLHLACARLSPEARVESRGAFFDSILGTLNHILFVDRWYVGQLVGGVAQSAAAHDTPLHADLEPLSQAQTASDRELIRFCDGLDASGSARVVRWTNAAGEPCSNPVHVVLAHLFLHQIHHRGQVHQMLCTTDVPAPQLDEFFLSGDAPLRAAEIEELGLGR